MARVEFVEQKAFEVIKKGYHFGYIIVGDSMEELARLLGGELREITKEFGSEPYTEYVICFSREKFSPDAERPGWLILKVGPFLLEIPADNEQSEVYCGITEKEIYIPDPSLVPSQ